MDIGPQKDPLRISHFKSVKMPLFCPLSLLNPPTNPRWGWQTIPLISHAFSVRPLLHSSANERMIFSTLPVLTSNTMHFPSSAATNSHRLLGLTFAARNSLPCTSSLANVRSTAPEYDTRYARSDRGTTTIVFAGACKCTTVCTLFDPTTESLSCTTALTEVGTGGLISRIGSAVLPSQTRTLPSALAVTTAKKRLLPSSLLPPSLATPTREWGRTT
mmetsp:Transcript_6213/g.15461  ORF Transcript_6213/g.15461 Transcript_6213/m.15461 type:complete len:217 (+) Transcript_6213:70-720(+)